MERPIVRMLAVAHGDRIAAQSFNQLEGGPARLLGDDLAKERSEQADFHGAWVAGARGTDSRRRRVRGRTAHATSAISRVRNLAKTRPQPLGGPLVRTLVS